MKTSRTFVLAVIVGLLTGSSALIAQTLSPVSLIWNPSSSTEVTSYVVRYGTTSGVYSSATNVGNRTSVALAGLQANTTYYLVVTARTAAGVESAPSNEITHRSDTAPTTAPAIALTAPANAATYNLPATVNLIANVSANGHTITKVQFYNGTSLLGESLVAPYTFSWATGAIGNYSLKARVTYDSGSTVDSAVISITVNSPSALPAPWQTVDIGAVGQAGSASQTNGTFSVTGAGKLSGTADSFRFVYQTLSSDGEIRVRINSAATNNSNGSFGVMIRETLTPGSEYAFIGVSQDLNYRWQRRSSTGGSTSTTISAATTPPNAYVRLVRSGNTLTGYSSPNGRTWTQVSSRSITMARNIYIGVVVASGSPDAPNTAGFSVTRIVP